VGHGSSAAASSYISAWRTGSGRPAKKGHPAILVEDIEDIVRRFTSAGQSVTWDSDFPGFRRFYATDPFGNRLEFLQPTGLR
jgi:predicted enzyme related to lactoylglutathione lyase